MNYINNRAEIKYDDWRPLVISTYVKPCKLRLNGPKQYWNRTIVKIAFTYLKIMANEIIGLLESKLVSDGSHIAA